MRHIICKIISLSSHNIIVTNAAPQPVNNKISNPKLKSAITIEPHPPARVIKKGTALPPEDNDIWRSPSNTPRVNEVRKKCV